MSTVYLEPPLEERVTEAEVAEARRQAAEDRLKELQVMASALNTRSARKQFWSEYDEEIVHLSAIETRKGTRWIHMFLP
ncbi:hypothetical protein DES53_106142 [Roseimicrobium gellanilyticum]|uniref:Uncharacterized protein n=1 Tax=Roseimicrobium gellanilyticum TaxID=748857 RepID=A0A366HJ88_9BACT|nr:hypothetical protein [Roseimicrobium gellanilyticum]RBP42435.1 hypothetical protein DES53_106142 [Roseimicrobium gellanilyticum]